MNQPTIQGNNAVLELDTGSGSRIFVCAKSFSINFVTDLIETTTVTSGRYKSFEGQAIGYTITLSSVLVIDTSDFGGWELLGNQLSLNKLGWRMSFTDSNANTAVMSGYCIVNDTTIAVSPSDLVGGDFVLQGTDALSGVPGAGSGGGSGTNEVFPYYYNAEGGETFFVAPELIGAEVIEVVRATALQLITLGIPATDQAKHDPATGRIDLSPDLPLGSGEWILVLYKG